MDSEFSNIKHWVKGIQNMIYKYPNEYHHYIQNIKNLFVNKLTEDNKNETVNNLLLLNEFEQTIQNMLYQYETLTNDILKYITSMQYKLTGITILND
ncbi:hypothetical protein M9Y10_017114 [Tritrichomonas musculus]|uniref:PH domain-containing protein n=1 Tax=Tritrichomonas musculus TaxID=1915356 RepID=A0ABR2HVZ1_9EUKA